MRAIKIRSGGQAYIMEVGETCPPGEVCFFPGEWELAQRMAIAASSSDPSNTFWGDLLEKKRTIPGYTLFSEVTPEKPPLEVEQALATRTKPVEITRPQPPPGPTDKARGLQIAKEICSFLAEKHPKKEPSNVAR